MSIEWEIKKKIKESNKKIQRKNEMIEDGKHYRNHYQNKRFKNHHDISFPDILSMPDDIIAMIGTFINPKEIIAVERINKIYKKQYEIVNRSTADWIKHLIQFPLLYLIKSIEYKNVKNKIKIRIEKLTIEELNARKKELIYCDVDYRPFNDSVIIVDKDKFMTLLYKDDWVHNMHTIPERFIFRIINYSKPTPRYLGQTYVDMRGHKYVVRYTNDFDCISYFMNKSYWPGEGMKGCFRHVLMWENEFIINIKKHI